DAANLVIALTFVSAKAPMKVAVKGPPASPSTWMLFVSAGIEFRLACTVALVTRGVMLALAPLSTVACNKVAVGASVESQAIVKGPPWLPVTAMCPARAGIVLKLA